MNHAYDATLTISYTEAAMWMTALDYALCHQGSVAEEELAVLRPMVDRMASTFGFNTYRLDRLLKGQKVPMDKAAFTTKRMASNRRAWFKRLRESMGRGDTPKTSEDSDG